MNTFIKITEIWVPGPDRRRLELNAGLYGSFHEFRELSEKKYFDYDQGLPGKAWAAGHPLVLTDFDHSYFQRTEAAKKIGLTSGIAMPIFSGEFLMAVVVFLCGDDEAHAGAIEAWGTESSRVYELGLIDGYYGTLKDFEWISRRIKMMRGFGLPGRTWEAGSPLLIDDLSNSETFVRPREAQQAGITTALGIPCFGASDQVYVMTFLSAKKTPIARRIEIWKPDSNRDYLIFHSGYCDCDANLVESYQSKQIKKGEGAIGQTWLTGIPMIQNEASPPNPESVGSQHESAFYSLLAMPIINAGILNSVVVFYI